MNPVSGVVNEFKSEAVAKASGYAPIPEQATKGLNVPADQQPKRHFNSIKEVLTAGLNLSPKARKALVRQDKGRAFIDPAVHNARQANAVEERKRKKAKKKAAQRQRLAKGRK